MLRHAEKASNKHAWQSDKVAVLLKAILGSSQKCYFGLLVILLQTADECRPVPAARQPVPCRASQAALRASM